MNTTLIANLPKEDRVRANTNPEINERIDRDLEHRLRCYAVQDKQVLSERIEELDREWDVERLLEAQAATLTFLGTLLGITRSRRWLILPLVVSGFFLQHPLQGW